MGKLMNELYNYKEALLHMLFPSLCFGCEENNVSVEEMICMQCRFSLPFTSFEKIRNNTVEKLFWGRVPLRFASSTFYFTERSSIQNIIHHIKYRDEKELGIFMGEMMGEKLANLFAEQQIDCCIPMPLHPKKEKKRGYNQASLLCEGIQNITGIPYMEYAIERNVHTSTQTRKTRMERWENVSSVFEVNDPSVIKKKNIAIIDDVITTGASTEACAQELMQQGAQSVSVASLAYTN
jgi:ComF family protein